jgi:hypothetical protein
MSDYAYVGLWDDFDLSPAFRKVLTVPSRTGTIIITLLAILVTFAANRSWKIWRFLLHVLLEVMACRFPKQTRAAIRQQQTILRNSETTGGALLSILEVAKATQSTSRATSTALVVFMFLHWGLFLALGILTTQVNRGTTVRSLATDACGMWLPSDVINRNVTIDLYHITGAELTMNTTVAAENYARNCYNLASTTISDCNLFAQQLIPYITELVPCPLRDATLCTGPSTLALAVESGNISWSNLGINWPHANDIYIRRRSIFTPINATSFLYDKAASRNYVNQHFNSDPPIVEPEQIQIFSFAIDEEGSNMTQAYRHNDNGGEYDVMSVSVLNGSFVLEALKPQELAAEVTIVAVRGRGVLFPNPSDDPLFYARHNHTVQVMGETPNRTTVYYKMGRPINVIVVQDLVEVCSKLTGYCSGWIGPSDLATLMKTTYVMRLMGPEFRKDYNTTLYALNIVATPLMLATTYYALLGRGTSALQATRQLQNGMQYMISEEQWRVEAENWFRISLASLQMAPHRMISTPELDRTRVVNAFDGAWACSSIKFHSSKHVTLSFFGILTIVIVCILLSIVSYLDEILGLLAANRTSSLLQPWKRDGYLQLLEESNMSKVPDSTRLPGSSDAYILDSERLMPTTYETYR